MAIINVSSANVRVRGSRTHELTRENTRVNTASLYALQGKNQEAIDTLNKYNEAVGKGGWLSSDDIASYRSALDNFVSSSNRLRELNRFFSDDYVDDSEDWQKTVSSMEEGYRGISDFYSKWKDEDEYKTALEAQKEYQKNLNYDIDAARREIEEMKSAIDSEYDSFYNETDKDKLSHEGPIQVASRIWGKDASEWLGLSPLSREQNIKIDELKAAITAKEQEIAIAERIQKAAAIRDAALNAPDFAEKSKYNSTVSYSRTWWDDLVQNPSKISYDDELYEWINGNEDVKADVQRKDSIASSDNPYDDGKTWLEKAGYDFIKDDERAIYNYIYATAGKDKAKEYLDSIADSLQYRYGEDIANGLKGKTLQEYIFGIEAGIDQFASGAAGIFAGGYTPQSATQVASGLVREDLKDKGPNLPDWLGGASLGQVGYDAVTTTSNMLPSILASTAVNLVAPGAGAAVGAGLLGASAGGNAKVEMLNLGYSQEQATIYGVLVGAAEGGMEHLLGGIGALGGKLSGKAVSSIASKVDNAIARVAIKLGNKGGSILNSIVHGSVKLAGNMASEGLEEGLQEVIDPWLREIATGVDWDDPNIDEVLYSSLLGALSAAGLEGAGVVSKEVNTYKSGKAVQGVYAGVEKLQDVGKLFPADSVAYKIADKVNAQTDAYTIGRLLYEVGGTISGQNLSDITDSLVEKGIERKKAESLAKRYNAILDSGMELSDNGRKILESADPLAASLLETIIGKDTEVYQRTKKYSELLASLGGQASAQAVSGGSAGENASVNQSAAEGKFTASEAVAKNDGATAVLPNDGASVRGRATMVDSDGEVRSVKVQKVSSIDNGVISLELEDGQVVKASDIELDSETDALLYDAVTRYRMSAQDANAFVATYYETSSDMPIEHFTRGFGEAYTYGKYGISERFLTAEDSIAAELSEPVRNFAYNLGKKEGERTAAENQKAIDAKKEASRGDANGKTGRRKGTVQGRDVSIADLKKTFNDTQNTAYKILCTFAEATGIDIVLYKSNANAQGVFKGAQGGFKYSEDKIYIDINAGLKFEKNSQALAKYTMLRTFSHEFTHFIEKWNPICYNEFRKAVFDELTARGENVNDLIEEKQAQCKGMTYDKASREVVAEAMTDILPDTTFVQTLANKHKNIFEKLLSKLKEFISDLKAYFKTIGHNPSREANALKEQIGEAVHYADNIVKLFDKVALEAVENYQATQKRARLNEVTELIAPKTAQQLGKTEDNIVQEQSRDYLEDNYENGDIRIRGWRYGANDGRSGSGDGAKNRNNKNLSHIQRGRQIRSGSGLSVSDNEGREISPEISEQIKDSKVIDSDGKPLALYHYTPGMDFSEISESKDIGFHSGTVEQAIGRSMGNDGRIFRSYYNIKAPLSMRLDIGSWKPRIFALFLQSEGFISKSEYSEIMELSIEDSIQDYNSPASIRLREILASHGYDGVAYPNGVEADGTSYMAFYKEQIITTEIMEYKNGEIISNVDTQYQQRTETLLDREVLEIAANELKTQISDLTPAEVDALEIFKNRLSDLQDLQIERAEQGRLYKEQQFGENVDRVKAAQTLNRMHILDEKIRRAEASVLSVEDKQVLKHVLQKARKVVETQERAQGKQALAEYREKAAKAQQQMKEHYQESRKKAVEGRQETALRRKIHNVVNKLEGLLKNGNKKKNIKEELQDTVASSLALASVLFNDEIRNEDIVRLGVDSVTEAESVLLNQYRDILKKRDSIQNKLDSIDSETPFDEVESLTKELDGINKQISSLDKELSDVFVRERARLNKTTVNTIIGNLKDEYSKLQNSENDYIKNAYDEYTYNRLNALQESLEGTSARDMNLTQLTELYDAFKGIEYMVRTSDKIFREGRAEELSSYVSDSQSEIKDAADERKPVRKAVAKVRDFVNSFSWNNHRPIDAFERLGSKTLEKLYFDYVRGLCEATQTIDEYGDLVADIRKKHGFSKWKLERADTTFKTIDGVDFKPTLGEKLAVYAYSQRAQAEAHITEGGFQFDTGSTYKETKEVKSKETENGKTKETKISKTYVRPVLSNTFRLDKATIANVISSLTEEQRAYVDDILPLLTQLGEKGNKASMTLHGIESFKEKIYFPLMSAKDYISSKTQTLGETPTVASLSNAGFTEKTKPGAKNPIVLRAFDTVLDEHIKKMSDYSCLVVPIENMRRVLDNIGRDSENGMPIATKNLIGSRFGVEAQRCFEQMLIDFNGGTSPQGAKSPTAEMFTRSKGMAVAANLSVVAQQYFAIYRAMEFVDPQYFIPFFKHNAKKSGPDLKQYEELRKYAPIAILKEMGGYDVGGSGRVEDFIGYRGARIDGKYIKKKISDIAMFGAEKMDKLGWTTIWKAVKAEVASKQKLTPGTEDFFKACGERFTEVIVRTQVFDSVASRSGFMRSKSDLVKFGTSFMGEPTVIFNRPIIAAIKLFRAVKSKNKQAILSASGKLVRVVTVVAISQILGDIAKSFIYGTRDDDEDEAFLEKWAEHFASALRDDLNPLNSVPFGRDIVSLLEGYSVERDDMTLIEDFINACNKLNKNIENDEVSFGDALNLVGAVGNLFGYPLKNVIREIKASVNFVGDLFDDVEPTNIWGAFAEGWSGKSTRQMLYEAYLNGDAKEIERLERKYDNQSEINSAIRRALRDNDKRIKEAAIAYISGDIAKYNEIAEEILDEGFFSKVNIDAAISAEIEELNEDEESEVEVPDKEVSFFKIDDYFTAIQSGDKQTADHVREEIINTYIANGRDRDEAEAAFDSSLRSSLRKYDSRIRDAAMAQYKLDVQGRIAIQKEILAEKNFSWDNIRLATSAEAEFIYDKIKDAKKAMDSGNTKVYDDIIEELIERGYPEDFILKALKK